METFKFCQDALGCAILTGPAVNLPGLLVGYSEEKRLAETMVFPAHRRPEKRDA